MAEAYATICEQERTISRLESQYNVMHRMHDKEVALKGEAQEQVATLTAERDEARREVCEREASLWNKPASGAGAEQHIAESRGWDCYRAPSPSKEQEEAMDRLAALDEELGL